jgi:hypothetical protein
MHKPETSDVKGKGKVFVDNLASGCESASKDGQRRRLAG